MIAQMHIVMIKQVKKSCVLTRVWQFTADKTVKIGKTQLRFDLEKEVQSVCIAHIVTIETDKL